MDKKTIAKNWLNGADEAWNLMLGISKTKDGHFALFFLHLSLEKTLKGLFLMKLNESPPFTHDLLQLTSGVKFETTEVEKKQLTEISTFNIAARYDDYKYRLREKATSEFVKEWMKTGENFKNRFLEEVKKYE